MSGSHSANTESLPLLNSETQPQDSQLQGYMLPQYSADGNDQSSDEGRVNQEPYSNNFNENSTTVASNPELSH